MRSHVTLLISATILGCGLAPRPGDAAQGSTHSSARGSVDGPSGVCDTVATLWRATGRAQVRQADTTMKVQSESVAQRGCAVRAIAPQGLDSKVQWATLYWAEGNARGWTTLTQYDADGPDGSERTFERLAVRCQLDHMHDGGDDSDSTYIPSPAVEERTFCWQKAS